MTETSEVVATVEPSESEAYSTPSLVEIGSFVEFTLGDGTSDIWDMGSGRKKE